MLEIGKKPALRVSMPSGKGVGERVRHFRKQRGWSQIELADGVCSSSLISLIEMGQHGATVEIIAKLADKLGVPLREICPEVDADCKTVVKLDLLEAYILRSEFAVAAEMLTHLEGDESLTLSELRRFIRLKTMYYMQMDQPERAIAILQPLIDEIERQQDEEDETICQLYTLLGDACFQSRNHANAYSAYHQAYRIANRLPLFEMNAAIAAYNMGKICMEFQMKEVALQYLDQAREYFSSTSDVSKLADAYFQSAVATQKKSYSEKALQLYQGIEEKRKIQAVKEYQAFHFEAKQDYRMAAKELYEIAMEMEPFHKNEQVMTLSRAALVCLDHSDVEEAQHYLQLATECLDKLLEIDPIPKALYHQVLAKLHLCEARYVTSIEEALRASEIYESIGLVAERAVALELAAEGLKKMDKHEQAFDTMKLVSELLRHKGL